MNNDDLQDSELQERMEKAEARVAKVWTCVYCTHAHS